MKPTIPTPPQAINVNRPVAKHRDGHPESRPLTRHVMEKVAEMIDLSEGKLTRTMLAQDIKAPVGSISEWLLGWRAAPGGERLLQIILWAESKQPMFIGCMCQLAMRSESERQ